MAKIDPLKNGYCISSYWGPRPETPAQIAARCQILLDHLAAISPKFSGWTFVGRNRPGADQLSNLRGILDGRHRRGSHARGVDHMSCAELAQLVEAGVHRDDDGVPNPELGYSFSVFARSRADPDGLSLRIHAGCWTAARFLTNTVHIETRPLCDENQVWLTLPVLKAAMLAIAAAWGVTWAAIYPDDLVKLWTPTYNKLRPTFDLAWVTYFSSRFAPMVTPPRSTIVEHTPQGGIVMTATEERFDVTNPEHLAAAREIEKAAGPINALPWPLEASV